jgi:hypothetical protein
VRGGGFEFATEGFENPGQIFQDLVVPETDHAVARLPKTRRPHLVAPLGKGVLAAVDLDNQLAR